MPLATAAAVVRFPNHSTEMCRPGNRCRQRSSSSADESRSVARHRQHRSRPVTNTIAVPSARRWRSTTANASASGVWRSRRRRPSRTGRSRRFVETTDDEVAPSRSTTGETAPKTALRGGTTASRRARCPSPAASQPTAPGRPHADHRSAWHPARRAKPSPHCPWRFAPRMSGVCRWAKARTTAHDVSIRGPVRLTFHVPVHDGVHVVAEESERTWSSIHARNRASRALGTFGLPDAVARRTWRTPSRGAAGTATAAGRSITARSLRLIFVYSTWSSCRSRNSAAHPPTDEERLAADEQAAHRRHVPPPGVP